IGFQEETKKAEVELSPLRLNPRTSQILLTRRLLVRLDFIEVEPGEVSLGGTRGRRPSSRTRVPAPGLIARLAVRDKGLYEVAFDDLLGPTARRPGPSPSPPCPPPRKASRSPSTSTVLRSLPAHRSTSSRRVRRRIPTRPSSSTSCVPGRAGCRWRPSPPHPRVPRPPTTS